MPRALVKIQSAQRASRWTLSPNQTSPYSPDSLQDNMQANGHYFEHHEPPLPRYESFDGSQYSRPQTLTRSSSGGFNGAVNGHYEDYSYNTPLEERASHQISLDTRMRAEDQDTVGQHLLYETAMLDSQSYELLDIAEVDALKKEHARLNSRIEAANRKLALESKVKDAAQNLQRLYSVNSKSRPDTPQSPDSPKKSRSSLLGSRGRPGSSGSGAGQTLHQAGDELAMSIRKVDELNDAIKGLMDRRQYVERKLLRHTAAVLAEQSARASKKISGTALTNGNHAVDRREEDDETNVYSPDEFDGIRDILHGVSAGSGSKLQKPGNLQKMQEEHEQQMASVQNRLEQLNHQLRHVINEASMTRGMTPEPEMNLDDQDDDPSLRLERHFNRLEDNLRTLEHEQQTVKAHYAQVQDSAYTTRNAVEEQLESVNHHLHNTLLLGSDMQNMETLREPPQATGHGYQHQLQYLEESLMSMEQLLQQHRAELDSAREASGGASRAIDDAHAKASSHAQKVGEYEATLGGLWEIMQHDVASRRPSTIDRDFEEDGLPSPGTPLKEDFSLQAFSARVQHLFDRAQSAKEQQEILRRQIQQQRDLNGKSDAEKDVQLTELQGQHDQLALEHSAAQEELTKAMGQRAQAESEASESRSELMNVTNELDSLKRAFDARHQEEDGSHAEKDRQLTDLRGQHDQLAVEHNALQEELATAMAQHAQAEDEASQSRSELMNVMNELDNFKRTIDARQQEREEMARELQTHQGHAASLQEQIEELEAQVSDLTDDARIFTVETETQQKEAERKHGETTERLAAAVTAKEAAEQRHADVQRDMEGLESEVVRLTTELTMAKAELDGAYGSRAERAREAQVAGLGERNKVVEEELLRLQSEHEGLRGLHEAERGEYEGLRGVHEELRSEHEGLRGLHEGLKSEHESLRGTHEAALADLARLRSQGADAGGSASSDGAKLLERELHDMTEEYQELTRESLELEKERGQLEELIDGLRDRCEALEAQLTDEKVRWMGIRSPGPGAANENGREMTSTMVLRQEFKKMMRETRVEGVKLLRVS